jgi:isoquinoline 1-oxidoreductase beta subunit
LYSGWDTYVAQVAEVEVTSAGEIAVRRVVCAADCGTMINPDTVAAQIESGVVFGISGALWGEITIRNGRVEQSNFHDYRVARMSEIPPIEVHLVRNLEKPGGLGEPGTAAVAPALANAIYAATGKRIRQLPLQKAMAQ